MLVGGLRGEMSLQEVLGGISLYSIEVLDGTGG